MKIAVIGGGPAGLYFARLRKLAHQDDEIAVFERNARNVTYGFGVSLADTAMDRYHAVDPDLATRINEATLTMPDQRIWLDDESYLMHSKMKSGAIGRQTLLRIMQTTCEQAGVRLKFDQNITDLDQFNDYDLVVGADGANSVVRELGESGFQPRRATLGNRFAWFGVNRALPDWGLYFQNRGGRYLVGHYYPYTPELSTFVAEVDAETWEQKGFGALTDLERRRYVEDSFAQALGGIELVENKSVWRQFQTIEATRWYDGNRVLLGDALSIAHFSIGSGTRLAMDDALALFQAFEACGPNVAQALPVYVAARRPAREKLMEAARHSYTWYEGFRQHMEVPLMDFIYAFMTRTGRLGPERLTRVAPQFMEDYSVAQKAAKAHS